VHSPAVATAAKTAAIIDLRMLNSSALDVSLLHDPVTFRLSAPAPIYGVSTSSYSLGNSELIEQSIKSIARNPYSESGLHRDGAAAQFDLLSAAGRIHLMINLPDVAES
jgi:hypothetical protein